MYFNVDFKYLDIGTKQVDHVVDLGRARELLTIHNKRLIKEVIFNFYSYMTASNCKIVLEDSLTSEKEWIFLDNLDLINAHLLKAEVKAGTWKDREVIEFNGIVTSADVQFEGINPHLTLSLGDEVAGLMFNRGVGDEKSVTFHDGINVRRVVNTFADMLGVSSIFVPSYIGNVVLEKGWQKQREESIGKCLDRLADEIDAEFRGVSLDKKNITFVNIVRDTDGTIQGKYDYAGDRMLPAKTLNYRTGTTIEDALMSLHVRIKTLDLGKKTEDFVASGVEITDNKLEKDVLPNYLKWVRNPEMTESSIIPNLVEIDGELAVPDLTFMPGSSLYINGIGKKLGGTDNRWYVNRVTHKFGREGYKVSFTAEKGVMSRVRALGSII